MRPLVLAAAASLGLAGPAAAVTTPTAPFNVPLPGTSVEAQPELGGTIIMDEDKPFGFPGAYSGTLRVRVVKGADNKLTFVWQITNAPSSKAPVWGLSVRGFPKASYDANWRKDGPGYPLPMRLQGLEAPNWHYRFIFMAPLMPGATSRMFFLKTDDVVSTQATANIVLPNGGMSPPVPIVAPGTLPMLRKISP